MTVKDFITQLQQFPDDTQVQICEPDGHYEPVLFVVEGSGLVLISLGTLPDKKV